MFFNRNRQCSICVTVPRKLTDEYTLIKDTFRRKAFLLFADKADIVVNKYDHPSARWKFTILFNNCVDDTDFYDRLVNRLIKWTITDVEAEFDKKTSRLMESQIIKDFKAYKEQKKLC